MATSCSWFYTWNNYSEDDEIYATRLTKDVVYHTFGREIASTTTRHLQGLIIFDGRKRFTTVQRIFGSGVHLERCRDTVASRDYCQKTGDFFESGAFPSPGSRGKRNDLESFKEDVKEGTYDLNILRERHSAVVAKYPRFVNDYIRQYRPRVSPESHVLRDWQTELLEKLKHEPDKRTVVFVVDYDGNSGKSWFCDYVESCMANVQIMCPGKKSDMAYMLSENTRILFIDAPRSKQGDFVQYDFLEDVKNGRIFSGKYESCMKYLNRCHVVVMMNEQPDMTKLSEDRYEIVMV